jgi:hypothetical protein
LKEEKQYLKEFEINKYISLKKSTIKQRINIRIRKLTADLKLYEDKLKEMGE